MTMLLKKLNRSVEKMLRYIKIQMFLTLGFQGLAAIELKPYRGSGFVAVEIFFTPRAKCVLEISLEEARLLGSNYIGSNNLLLSLLRVGEDVAACVLDNLGADPSNIRT